MYDGWMVCIFVFDSLIATIKTVRPDLLQNIAVTAPPISEHMPSHLQQPTQFIEGIGEPVTSIFLTERDSDFDPTGWYKLFCPFPKMRQTHSL
jgi:hypothetical protein